ncbi:unnamed protein product [Ilex paraguariensis]|uniref:Protein TILLER ANGLE CONTROL 1 n=1 Tax=Ilex paraguariensis TaxID=185542 RepID=A0ABC8TC98_9AQUA
MKFFFLSSDGLGRDVKKAEFLSNETDTQVLLEHVVPNGWREGILTIGTFGFDPLKNFDQQNEGPIANEVDAAEEEKEEEECVEQVYFTDSESDNIDLEDEQLNPLVFTAFNRGLEKDTGSDCDENAPKVDPIMNIGGIPLSTGPHEHGLEFSESYQKIKKKERTTLAELFSADADGHAKQDHGKVQPEFIKKPIPPAKNYGLSFAKKLIPGAGGDSCPIRRLHTLMTKMLKRKIHPDLEGKIQKQHSETVSSMSGFNIKEYGANASVSLLQTQVKAPFYNDNQAKMDAIC